MAKLKSRLGAKKKPADDDLRGLELSNSEMKARIHAYKVFRADSIEIVIRPGADAIIREFVGPLIGKRSSGIYVQRIVTKKKKGSKKKDSEPSAVQESA